MRVVYLRFTNFPLSNLLKQLKISLSAHVRRPHVGANMGYDNHARATLNDYGTVYTRLRHYDVVTPFAALLEIRPARILVPASDMVQEQADFDENSTYNRNSVFWDALAQLPDIAELVEALTQPIIQRTNTNSHKAAFPGSVSIRVGRCEIHPHPDLQPSRWTGLLPPKRKRYRLSSDAKLSN